jgi:small multidrug resistance pump
MLWPYYLALLGGVLVGVAGQILLKMGAQRSGDIVAQFLDPYTIVGFAVYALAAILYIISLKRIPLSVAFPSVSLSYIVVAVAAHLMWQEPLGLPQFGGIALISGGILLLHWS